MFISNDQLDHYHHAKRVSPLSGVRIYTHAERYQSIRARHMKSKGALYLLVKI